MPSEPRPDSPTQAFRETRSPAGLDNSKLGAHPVRASLRSVTEFFRGRWEGGVLFALLLVLSGVWVFGEITDEVLEGETEGFDRRILLFFREADVSDPIGPTWLEEAAGDFTALGGIPFLSLLIVSAAVYLAMTYRGRAAMFVALSTSFGSLLAFGLKEIIDRPRPDLVHAFDQVYTASFPSGHAMMSAVVLLTLCTLLAGVHSRRRVKLFFVLWAVFVSGLVGLTRVYLGVHWPTDVLAGWTLGVSWALLTWLLMRWFQHRGWIMIKPLEPAG